MDNDDKKWGPSGVAGVLPLAKLESPLRQSLLIEMRRKGVKLVKSNDADQFFEELEQGLNRYRAHVELADRSRPAAARASLQAALDAALKLVDKLNELDGNSLLLLQSSADGGCEAVREAAGSTVKALGKARHLADAYPRAGALPDYARSYLAADVAGAMRKHLGVEPTTTREGLFQSVLEVVLEIATGKEAHAVQDLVRRGLKTTRIEHSSGLIEYIPPKSK